MILDVEPEIALAGWPDCGLMSIGHGRRIGVLRQDDDEPTLSAIVRQFEVGWDAYRAAVTTAAQRVSPTQPGEGWAIGVEGTSCVPA